MNREEFIKVVINEVNKTKHQREGTGLKIGKICDMPGKHTVTRRCQQYLGLKLSDMLKEHCKNGILYKEEDFLDDTKSFPELAKELADNETRPSFIIRRLVEYFNITEAEVNKRFKLYFNMSIAEYIDGLSYPTRTEIENALLIANDVNEMKCILNMSNSNQWKGLLDKEFGYSTFISAKSNFTVNKKVGQFNPNLSDNKAILISQYLGDGSFDKVRNSLRIIHGIKQLEYLKFKVAVLSKAFPSLYTKVTVHTHSQGHKYGSYYSGKFSAKYSDIFYKNKASLVKHLTPLGWLLYFLDDGNYFYNIDSKQSILSIATIDKELQVELQKVLLTYNIKANISKTQVSIQNKVDVVKFINSFIKPYENIIPACMKYKYDMKI